MPETILKTRTIPPRQPEKIISRKRLNFLFKKNPGANLILIHAPAGYGKTTAALDFHYSNNNSFAWLQVSDDMKNFFPFFNHFIHSIKNINAGFGSKSLELLQSLLSNERHYKISKNSIKELSETFVNDLYEEFNTEFYLTIDDLDRIIESSWLDDFLDYFLRIIPQNIHLVITTRILPGLDFAYLNSKRKMIKICDSELIFDKNEISFLMKEIYHHPPDNKGIELLNCKLGGWITAIHLFLNAYGINFSGKLNNINYLPGQAGEEIYNLFADEYFRSLDDGLREFLLVTSITDSFDHSITNYLLDYSSGKKYIKEVFRKNLFIQSRLTESNGKLSEEYFYHNLFREFLIAKLHEVKNRTFIVNLYKKIFEYYLNENNITEALKFGIRAQDYKRSVPLLIENFRGIFDKGNYAELWDRINEIDKKILYSNPYLLYFKSLLERFFMNNPDAALSDIEKAISIFKKKKDEDYLIRCYISKSRILLNKGNNAGVIKELSLLSKKKFKAVNLAKLYNHIALAHYLSSDLDTSLEYIKRSLAVLTEKEDVNLKSWIYNLTGNIYLVRGEFSKAILEYEQAVNKSPDIRTRFGTLCNLVLSHSQTGNFEKAGKYLDEIEKITTRFSISSFKLNSLIAKQAYYFEQCSFHRAIKILEELSELSSKMNNKYYLFLSYRLTSDCYYYLCKFNRAEEYFDLAKKYVDKNNELEAMELLNMKALLKIMREPFDESYCREAKAGLSNSYKFFDSNNFYYNKAQSAFHLAGLDIKLGKFKTAAEYISESFHLCRENDYIPFLERELLSSRKPFDFAMKNKIDRDLVKTIFETLFAKLETSDPGTEDGKWLLENIDPLYDMKFSAFGILEFKVRGKIIPEDRWIKKKRKLILAYLMLSPDNDITKDRLIEIFYPDTPVQSVENIFHQTVSKLRNLLIIDEDKKNKKNSSLLIYQDKILKLDTNYNFYIDTFEFDRYYLRYSLHDLSMEERTGVMKKAVDLYNGEFMEGYYETWVEDIRQDYGNKFISICTDLVLTLKEEKKYEEVIKYSSKLLRFDDLNEDAYVSLTEGYKMTGNIKAARELIKTMEAKFKKLLNEKPPGDLIRAIEEILKR